MKKIPTQLYMVVDKHGNFIKIYRLKYYADKKCETYSWDRDTRTYSYKPNGNQVFVTNVDWTLKID